MKSVNGYVKAIGNKAAYNLVGYSNVYGCGYFRSYLRSDSV